MAQYIYKIFFMDGETSAERDLKKKRWMGEAKAVRLDFVSLLEEMGIGPSWLIAHVFNCDVLFLSIVLYIHTYIYIIYKLLYVHTLLYNV